jgi:hypothetical protein
MTSLIEQKNAKLFLDLEEQVYSKRLAETFKKVLINDFEESNANRDRLEGILQREREIKRVFEKEVGKLKKEYKTLKVENTKLNHLCKEEDRKHTEKNMEDQRYANLNDNNEALDRMDYEILILKERNNDLNEKIVQHDRDLISCVERMAHERVDYMNSLKEVKQGSKDELEKNLEKISTMKENLANLEVKYAESDGLRKGYVEKNAVICREYEELRGELDGLLMKVKETKREAKIMRNERVSNNKVGEKRFLATNEEICRIGRENYELQMRIDALEKGFGDPMALENQPKKMKLFGDQESENYC